MLNREINYSNNIKLSIEHNNINFAVLSSNAEKTEEFVNKKNKFRFPPQFN